MLFYLVLLLAHLGLACCAKPELLWFYTLDDFSFDENDRLTSSHVLFSETGCDIPLIENLNPGIMSSELQKNFGFESITRDDCAAVSVIQGAPKHLLHAVLPQQKFNSSTTLREWLDTMLVKERGWISFHDTDMDIFWVPQDGERRKVAVLRPGESNTVWLNSILGHTFHIVDQRNGELVASTYVEVDGVQIIGTVPRPDPSTHPAPEDVIRGVHDTLRTEYGRSLNVKRTFTALGFDKGRLPDDIFCSILTYYYNNRLNVYFEDWESFHVNWWESANW